MVNHRNSGGAALMSNAPIDIADTALISNPFTVDGVSTTGRRKNTTSGAGGPHILKFQEPTSFSSKASVCCRCRLFCVIAGFLFILGCILGLGLQEVFTSRERSSIRADIETLREQYDKLKIDMKDSQTDFDNRLSKSTEIQEEYNKTIEEMQTIITQLQNTTEENFRKMNETLEERLDQQKIEIEDKLQEHEDSISSLEYKNAKLESEIIDLKSSVEQIEKQQNSATEAMTNDSSTAS